ncbi:MAG: class II fructose-1,6-bisphosphate aldolase [Treponema sp.]|uniref:class II fructose-bisphosphate aldolase n=1 Tax=Treponema sp. TaxID=166 RepID=UPI00298D7E04|nr:class II fructose-bisphosphate aldolase [Treponema sp.]MBR5934151.1 class II fructose-1,6-bisphosphate aldolase [Treponema sp.]
MANVSYKELGLVNTKEMFAKAIKGGYAIPAYNFNNMEQMQAIIQAAVETKSPVILQVSKGARAYANGTLLRYMAQGAIEYAKELGCAKPQIVLHLDHGPSFEVAKDCIDNGFSSVMIDGSALPYDENVALTKKVVEYAHARDVTVEAELGVLGGVEDDVAAEESKYTKPEEVVDFVTKTGCDSLAISIGTSHGRCKFTPEQCTRGPDGVLNPPPLAFDVLEEIEKKIPGFPIVLHGSSSVPQEYVKIIEQYGGKIPDSVGIPEEQLRKAAKSAVCKINIDSDGRLAMTAAVRKHLAENPGDFDPRQYLKPARDELIKMYSRKNIEVLGSAGHLDD